MADKSGIMISASQVLRSNSWLYKSLPTLTTALFFSMIVFWAIGNCKFKAFQNEDYVSIRLIMGNSILSSQNLSYHVRDTYAVMISTASHSVQNSTNNTSAFSSPSTLQNLTRNIETKTSFSPQNFTDAHSPPPSQQAALNITPSSASTDWIAIELEPNYTSNLLARWLTPGGQPCREVRATQIKIPGLDDRGPIELSTGDIHQFVFSTYDDAGNPRCLGGDYFETDLSGESWKSRPPVKDLGNGSHLLSLQIHPDFAGDFHLSITLLFRSFEGLKFSSERFGFRRELRNIKIKFFKGASQLPDLKVCQLSDFSRDIWSGRWTRHGKNDKCRIDHDGRYRCLDANFPCKSPWCSGSLGLIESNGWVYSSHCAFQVFSEQSAWNCLQNRWLFFWGDSNHVDSVRNMLNFVLGLPGMHAVTRRFDMTFTNPNNVSQSVRITNIFNGHWDETGNYEGLNSLRNEGFRELLKKYFNDSTMPDTIIWNSGLHDGVHWRSIRAFTEGADYAAKFWEEALAPSRAKGRMPRLLFRSTIATGGYARVLSFNPNKMDVYNMVLLEKMRQRGLVSVVIDNFDMTFPWHFDNRCNDGVHYGRAPAKARWRDGEIGHQYFVDLMLGHVLLNAICARV